MLHHNATLPLKNLPFRKNSKVLFLGNPKKELLENIQNQIPQGELIFFTDKTNLNIDKNVLKNLLLIKTSVDNGKKLPIKDSYLDIIIVWHELRNIVYRESFLKECRRILKNSGVISVIEIKKDEFGIMTHPDSRIEFDDMLEYLDRSGFVSAENFDTMHDEYGIISGCSSI